MSWNVKELGKICDIVAGQSPPSETYNKNQEGLPFFQGKTDFGEFFPTVRTWCSKPNKLAEPDDILISVRAPVGATNVCNIVACIGRGLAAIKPSDQINQKYLLYYFRYYEPIFSKSGNGAIFSAITMSDLKSVQIPLPPLPIQKKIAAVLEKADELRRQREEQIKRLDDLLQATFLDMFGDPVTNPKGWKTGKIGDLISSTHYGTSGKAYSEGEFPVLRMGNITYNGSWNFEDLKYMDLSEEEQRKYLVTNGEVLFNRTNSKELVGKTAVYREHTPMAYAGYLIKLKENEKGNSEFIAAYLNSPFVKLYMRENCKSIVGMANINAQEVQKIPAILPPKSLQDKFAEKIHLMLRVKFKLEEKAKPINNLFNSLMQRAFKGELDLK